MNEIWKSDQNYLSTEDNLNWLFILCFNLFLMINPNEKLVDLTSTFSK